MKKFLVIAVFALIPAFVWADFTLERWKYERPVNIPVGTAPGYVRVTLDRAVAAGSKRFKDLRVIEGANANREVAYQFSVEAESASVKYMPSAILDTMTDSSGRAQFILDLGNNGSLHSRIHIETATKNYRRQVSLYAAFSLAPHNSSDWSLLTDKGYIFKFSDDIAGFSTASGEVSYPESSARYLRVVIENGPEGPLSLASASVYRYEVSSAKEETELLPADIFEKADEQATEIVVDLGASGIPTHKVELFADNSGNFSRSAYLFGSDSGASWTRIGAGYLSRIETAKFKGGDLSIDYPESTYRFYKVSVRNFDDAPLRVQDRIRVTHILRTIVFEANPSATYRLFYGNPAAYSPRYDLSRYFEFLETASLPEARLGAERENSEYVPPAPLVVPFTERNKVLLNVTLGFLVLLAAGIMGWYIWRHLRNGSEFPVSSESSTRTPESSPQREFPKEPPPTQ